MNRTTHLFSVTLILLAAFALRFHRLDEIPPGMTHDEASVGFFTRHVSAGKPFEIDAPFGYANEPFTQYSAGLLMRLIGPTDYTLRAHQAAWGIVTVLMTYLWGRAAFGRSVGLGGAALVAVSFWPLMTSRFALNSNPSPALFTASIWFLWRAGRPTRSGYQRRLSWAGFALCLAASLYTYEAARGAWLALPVFLIYLAVLKIRDNRCHRPGVETLKRWNGRTLERPFRPSLLAFAAALAAGTGLALPHLLDPAAWGRTSTLAGPLTAAAGGDFGPLIRNSLEALGTLLFEGDPFVVYNIPGRPVLDPAMGALFVAGLIYCLRHWRRPACAFAVMWLGAGFLPAMAIGAFTMMLHAITSQAVMLSLPALAVAALARRFVRFERPIWLGYAALVFLTAIVAARDYFVRWGEDTDTRAAYFSNFRAVTAYLHETPYAGNVALSSPFPGLPHDPFTADLRVRRDDLDLRWFDAREAFVFQATDKSLLVIPSNTPPDPLFASRLPLAEAERHLVRETDVDPYFDTLIWNPAATLAEWLADGSLTVLDLPADFGGAASLIAYRLVTPQVRPGETAVLITIWRIGDPAELGPAHPTNYAREAAMFVHLLDAASDLVAGQDRLDAPAWNWHTGDAFAQILRPLVPPDLAPGDYRLEVGLYIRPTLERLPVLDAEGNMIGDTIELGKVSVSE